MGKILSRPLGIEQSDGDPIPAFDFITLANMRDGIAKPVQVVGIDITENGEYEAPPGYAYSPANVNVSGGTPTLITKTITENGTYNAEDDDADGYSEVTVNVPSGGGVQIATGTVIGDDTTIVKFACSFLPDVVYIKRIDTTVLSSRVFGGFIGFSNGTNVGSCQFQNNANTLNFSQFAGSLTNKAFSLSNGVVSFNTNLSDRKFSSACEYMYYAVKWTTE